jgi:hypothetical protein
MHGDNRGATAPKAAAADTYVFTSSRWKIHQYQHQAVLVSEGKMFTRVQRNTIPPWGSNQPIRLWTRAGRQAMQKQFATAKEPLENPGSALVKR